MNVQKFVYYLNQEKPVKRATVVLAINLDNGNYARGVAFCSPDDNFCKATGRTIATNRAMAALEQKRSRINSTILREELVALVPAGFYQKVEFNPVLTNREAMLYNIAMGHSSFETAAAA